MPSLDRGALDLLAARLRATASVSSVSLIVEQLEDADPALVAGLVAARAAALAVEGHPVGGGRHVGRDAGLEQLLDRSAWYISQQCEQSFRARRWASTPVTAEPVRNGSTPISFRRVIAPGASFVCSVESTKWPVRAASIEILAVSPSRISPTITTSGSERRIERSAEANVRPARDVDLHLVDAREPVLDRILDGDDVDLGPVDLGQRRVERRRLTGAGRPRDEERAGRAADDLLELRAHVVGEAELLERRRLLRLVEEAHDDRLALDRRQGRDADVEHAAGGGRVQRDAAVLRLAALGDVELREHLQARRDAGASSASGSAAPRASTPSMRKRTTSASSCGSKWMSEAPSSAAWKMIELTRRTSGASEMPSSTSRSSASSSASSSELVFARRPRGRRRPRRRGPGGGARRGCPRARRRRARAGSGVASRSSSIAWTLPGSATATRSDVALERVRDRDDALEHVQRDLLRRRPASTPSSGEVDEAAAGSGRRACGRCPSDEATPSSTSAWANEPPCSPGRGRARACRPGPGRSARAGRRRARPAR